MLLFQLIFALVVFVINFLPLIAIGVAVYSIYKAMHGGATGGSTTRKKTTYPTSTTAINKDNWMDNVRSVSHGKLDSDQDEIRRSQEARKEYLRKKYASKLNQDNFVDAKDTVSKGFMSDFGLDDKQPSIASESPIFSSERPIFASDRPSFSDSEPINISSVDINDLLGKNTVPSANTQSSEDSTTSDFFKEFGIENRKYEWEN